MSTAKKYVIHIREVHVATHEVEAYNIEEALKQVNQGLTEVVSVEYSHRLPEDTWVVEDAEGNVLDEWWGAARC